MAAALGLCTVRCVDTDGLSSTSDPDASAPADAQDALAAPGAGEIYASGQTGAFGLARLGSTLYWTSAGSDANVSSCAIDTCTKPTVISKAGKATAIMTSTRPYWVTEGQRGISFLASDGTVGIVPTSSNGVWVTSSATRAYISEADGDITLMQGDPPSGTTTFLSFGASANRLAANGGAIAWTSTKTQGVAYCGNSGCTAANSVVASNEQPVAIAMDASTLFWTTAGGAIRAVEHDGTNVKTKSPRDVATSLPEPAALAPDDTGPFLYFAARGTATGNYLDGVVGKVLKSGGAVTLLAVHQARPASVLVTDTHVYWTNEYDGTIRRAPK